MKKLCWTYRIAPKFSWHDIFVNFVTSLLITKFFLVKFSNVMGVAVCCAAVASASAAQGSGHER